MSNTPSAAQSDADGVVSGGFAPEIHALRRRLEREQERLRLAEEQAIGRVSTLLDDIASVTEERDSLRAQLSTALVGWSAGTDDTDVGTALWNFTLDLQHDGRKPLTSAGESIERLRHECGLWGVALFQGSAATGFDLVVGSNDLQEQDRAFDVSRSVDLEKISDRCRSNTVTSVALVDLVTDQDLLDSRVLDDLWVSFGLALESDGTEHIVMCVSEGDQSRGLREVVCVYTMAEMNYVLMDKLSADRAAEEAVGDHHFLETVVHCLQKLESIEHASAEAVIEDALEAFARIENVNALVWWEIDEQNEQYRRLFTVVEEAYGGRPIVPAAAFGTRPFMDRVRLEGTSWVIPDKPTPLNPSMLGVVPVTESTRRGFLLAARESSEAWDPSLTERLQTVSNLIHLGLISLSQTSRIDAVVARSSIPVVVRRQSDLSLVDCNNAFSELVGMQKEELLGTGPEHVLYPSVLEVPNDLRDESAWMFEHVGEYNAFEGHPGVKRVYRTEAGPPRLTLTFCTAPLDSGEIINFIFDETESATALKDAHSLAVTDPLTHLLNRFGFLDEAGKLYQRAHGLLIAVVDIDRFRHINEDFDVAVGDSVLCAIAERLSHGAASFFDEREVRSGRVGPDTFAIAVQGPLARHQSEHLARHLIEESGRSIDLPPELQTPWGAALEPSVSIGLVNVTKGHDIDERLGHEMKTALSKATDAAQRPKEQGGRSFRWYEERATSTSAARLALETELRRALHNDEFRAFFQPIVSMATGEILGAEALVRWQHPRDGLTGPGAFIELAEQVGLAEEISNVVLQQAAQECQNWGGPYVSVNLAPRQLGHPAGTPDFIRGVLKKTGLSPGRLKVEVTERSIIRDIAEARTTLQHLRDFGVSILLDDFGTGYNAISYLRDLPVDGLKIDRSFVSNLSAADASSDQSVSTDAKFVRIITGVADTFALDCIAEGIENDDQRLALQRAGIDAAQGYFFYRPMPPRQFQELVLSQRTANIAGS